MTFFGATSCILACFCLFAVQVVLSGCQLDRLVLVAWVSHETSLSCMRNRPNAAVSNTTECRENAFPFFSALQGVPFVFPALQHYGRATRRLVGFHLWRLRVHTVANYSLDWEDFLVRFSEAFLEGAGQVESRVSGATLFSRCAVFTSDWMQLRKQPSRCSHYIPARLFPSPGYCLVLYPLSQLCCVSSVSGNFDPSCIFAVLLTLSLLYIY